MCSKHNHDIDGFSNTHRRPTAQRPVELKKHPEDSAKWPENSYFPTYGSLTKGSLMSVLKLHP